MKYTSRVQPFVAVTQKEANAIEMERKLDDIIQRTDLNPHLKMRLYQDRMARLINFRKDNELKDEQSEPFVAESAAPLIDLYSAASMPFIDDFKVIQNYNKSQPSYEKDTSHRQQETDLVVESTPSRTARPTLTPSLDWDNEALGFSPKNTPGAKKTPEISVKKLDKSKQNRELQNLELPSYMQPRQPTRRQRGSGSSNRLYVRTWV